MKKLYTSYFANKNIPSNFVKVATCRYLPSYGSWQGLHLKQLAPSKETFDYAKTCKDDSWKVRYENDLKKVDLEKVISELPNNSVLMCYEKDCQECHRSVLSKKIQEVIKNRGLDVSIEEFKSTPKKETSTPATKPKQTDTLTLSLF